MHCFGIKSQETASVGQRNQGHRATPFVLLNRRSTKSQTGSLEPSRAVSREGSPEISRKESREISPQISREHSPEVSREISPQISREKRADAQCQLTSRRQ